MSVRFGLAALTVLVLARPAFAQQRPLLTEDPETIGAGRILVEGGIDFDHEEEYPVSGLKGNLWRVPTLGISFGLSSIAEFQIDGSPYTSLAIASRDPRAPLASQVTATGSTTTDVQDFVVATKIRILAETENRPAFGMRFATRLPNASNESGLGLDTTDFFATILGAKTVQSIRVVGNIGLGILSDPTFASRQNDVLIYGVSFARALTNQAEVVGEIIGRASTRSGGPLPGTESRSILKAGGRFTHKTLRLDAAILFGLTAVDPSVGFTTGFTYVFNAFKVP